MAVAVVLLVTGGVFLWQVTDLATASDEFKYVLQNDLDHCLTRDVVLLQTTTCQS